MCGIVGCTSRRNVNEIILDGLKRLEYRGYDSAGIVLIQDGRLNYEKTAGKISLLEELLKHKNLTGRVGLAHTRWATHGVPSKTNAHPHFSCDNRIALIHNGIIENYEELKERLIKQGHKFSSETDTETVVHLIEEFHKKYSPEESIARAVKELSGTFVLGVIFLDKPDTLFGVRCNAPLVIGVGKNETFIASDVPAILPYTKKVIFAEEGQIIKLTTNKVEITDFNGHHHRPVIKKIDWDIAAAEKCGYPHFMLKEIYEQPESVRSTINYYVTNRHCCEFKSLAPVKDKLKKINRIIITACGTAWHAGLVGKYAIEELCGIPVETRIASEFRYGNPVLDKHTLLLAVSQSGETADTLVALRQAKCNHNLALAICNVLGSSLTREADATMYTYAGPEISVASTKAYTSQITVLLLFAIYLAKLKKNITPKTERQLLREFKTIPAKLKTVISLNEQIKAYALKYQKAPNFMYIARRYNFPNAYEGALKLKEISYTHAEGYCAGEMKHGPLALVDSTFPTVAIVTKSIIYDKMISNIKEIKARKGIVIALATTGDEHIKNTADDVIYIPETEEIFSPILTVIPLQLLAYHMAVAKGKDVDQPRNLAKSVTVE